MKITRKQLNRIIKESIWDDLGAASDGVRVHKPIQVVNDDTFYWTARRAEEVQPGFVVPVSGPIERARELEDLYEEARQALNPTAPSRLNCVYVCPALNGFCRKPTNRTSIGHQGGIYRVRVTGKVFFADAEYWTEGSFRYGRGDIEGAKSYAEGYWEGINPQEARNPDPDYAMYQYHEVLVDGKVEVIERVY